MGLIWRKKRTLLLITFVVTSDIVTLRLRIVIFSFLSENFESMEDGGRTSRLARNTIVNKLDSFNRRWTSA